jgi:hypothetical protein
MPRGNSLIHPDAIPEIQTVGGEAAVIAGPAGPRRQQLTTDLLRHVPTAPFVLSLPELIRCRGQPCLITGLPTVLSLLHSPEGPRLKPSILRIR